MPERFLLTLLLLPLQLKNRQIMAFEATKREWGELYAFFRLLADGYVYGGTPDVKKNEALRLPVAMVQREEHDGTRQYILEKDTKSGLLNTGLQFIIATCICMISYFICSNISINNVYINIFINVIICCVVPNLTLFLMYRNSYYFKFLLEHINSLIKRNRYISN